MPATFDSAVIPTGLPLGTLDTSRPDRNTFHWGPLQLSGIGNLDVHNWTWAEFKRAHIRHWLGHYDTWDTGHLHVSDTLAWEQAPSPDGTAEGQVTWYDYAGKDPNNLDLIGTGTIMPAVIARVLPDGSTWYHYFEHNSLGKPTMQIETYTKPDGSLGTRTHTFAYAANGIDLIQQLGPQGGRVLSNYFGNVYHLVDASYDALNRETLYTYNAKRQLTSRKSPGGLTTTNLYFASGTAIDRLDKTIDLEIKRTNSFTYLNDLIYSQTDERGLTMTNYWDGLQRLTGQKYPDGTTTSNIYTALDITARKDRLGNWNFSAFNGIRQVIAETNANNVITRYGYCTCGALLSVTNGWNTSAQLVTSFAYDYQGNRRFTYHPDVTVTNWFDALGRKVATADPWATNWFGYNNQGLLTSVTNAYGAQQRTVFDIEDRPIYVADANNVTVTNTYDDLGRLCTRTAPDGGVEQFGYSARGMVAYTNQLAATNFYAYDEAGRKTFETNANNELIRYTNNAAGDLLSLTDGKNQTTKWNYDEYGRVTNKLDQVGVEILRYKYDPDSRLTNRWSKAKGDTKYKYDPAGNRTNIDYAVSTDVRFKFDALNRVTNMVDAAGTTIYSYAAGGQLWTEDGPWASDTVTNFYSNRLRTNLSLAQPTGRWTNAFNYDGAKRLTNVTSQAGGFNYYLGATAAASPLIQKLSLPNTSYITNAYDNVARWRFTKLNNSSHTTLDSALYGYNAGHQRTTFTNAAGTFVQYTNDPIGQLKIANSSVNSEDRGYQYDAAWNLNYRTNNGTLGTFTVDGKNQLTTAPSPVGALTYDNNGNLVISHNEARQYAYDDENQFTELVRTVGFQFYRTTFTYDGRLRLRILREYEWTGGEEESSSAPAPGVAAKSIDPGEEGTALGPGGGGSWTLLSETRYIYDGMRVIQERDMSNTPLVSYTRGTDLSGSLEGAGGIGGLLARSHGYSSGNWTNHNFYHTDGNGNITYLVNSSQTLAASYRYDPFGNTTASSGTLAALNVYRFSSKEIHVNSGLYYYGYRWYAPNLQRWPNRDPIGELEHLADDDLESSLELNLYGFVANNPNYYYDPDGQRIKPIIDLCKWIISKCKPKPKPTPKPKPKPNPCGDCTPAQHAVLQGAVTAACKTGTRACNPTQDSDTLKANLAKNLACAAARDAVNKTCYKGGDPGHRQAADEARRAAQKCADLIAQRGLE